MPPDGPFGPVVGPDWLRANRERVVVVDVRWYLDGRSGLTAYEQGHVAGAIFCDLDRDLAAPPSPEAGRHPLPGAEAFASAMSALGIGDDDVVVAYDDAGGTVAARLVWMLRALGHPAALLDGGLAASGARCPEGWPEPLETAANRRPAARFTARPWPSSQLATMEEVAAMSRQAKSHERGGLVVVDARAAERYRGEVEPIDPRAGHIPGAVSLPTAGHVDPGSQRFLPPDELRRRFDAAGVGEGTEVVAYCGSGINACHELLALEAAGLGPGRLYAGSWSQWSSDDSRPAATGP